MNNDYWDYIGGRDYLAQYDENGNYIAHYGVKGMKWGKHAYKTVNPDGTYEYGTENNQYKRGYGHIGAEFGNNRPGSNPLTVHRRHKTTYTTSKNRHAVVNPNADKFGIKIKNGTSASYNKSFNEESKSVKDTNGRWHMTYHPSEKSHVKDVYDDHYLQVNYNKKKVDAAKNKIKSTATKAKNLIGRLRNR